MCWIEEEVFLYSLTSAFKTIDYTQLSSPLRVHRFTKSRAVISGDAEKGRRRLLYERISTASPQHPPALITIDEINAGAVIQARAAGTVVVVDFAMPAGEARLTQARVGIHVVHASGAVLAWVGAALVHVELAVPAFEAGPADTRVVRHEVFAATAVAAWRGVAVIVVDLAMLALETKAAHASK